MKIKQAVILIVVIVALAGAGIFAYKSFGSSISNVPATQESKAIILPYGSKLDFDKVDKYNQTGRQAENPTVNPAEIGSQLNGIISQ